MTDWVDRDVSHLGVDRIATSPTAFALYQNLFAFAEKAPGSPVLADDYIVTAMMAAGAVTGSKIASGTVSEGNLASSAVSQGKLKTTTGTVQHVLASTANLTLPGGTYGFYPQVSSVDTCDFQIAFNFAGGFSTNISIANGSIASQGQAIQRYVQGSPPYDLGDGNVPLFVFMGVDSNGDVKMLYVAEDPPWAHNGPTNIVPDVFVKGVPMKRVLPRIDLSDLRHPVRRAGALNALSQTTLQPELRPITQEMKNRDMPIVPHPFMANDLERLGLTVTILDPVSDLAARLLELNDAGTPMPEILHGRYLKLGNEPLERRTPPGVMAVSARWS